MDWLQISIYTTRYGIEHVCGVLYQLGITGLEIEDEEEFKEFLEENRQSWDYVDEELLKQKHGETRVRAYVSDNASGHEMLLEIRRTIAELKQNDTDSLMGRLEIEVGSLSEEDWANNWKKYFHPLEIGERLLIKPEWEELTAPTDRLVFNINPGMSFGTGSHFTTQLCLEELEKYVTPGQYILDMGCGSGILSVISLMLGAEKALAVDIDPNAVNIAYENADRNGVERARYEVLAGNLITDKGLAEYICQRKYPVIVANIVADVIIALAPMAARCIAKDGVFITSGIIEDRIEDVRAALAENGFKIEYIKQRADWAAIVCRPEV